MDHLLLPTGVSLSEEDIVPCLANEDYIGVGFKEYALRNGFRHAIPEHGSLSFGEHEATHPTPRPLLEKFLQSWAYFALLQQIIGPEYRHHDFVVLRTTDGLTSSVLSTKNLVHLLKAAFSRSRDPIDQAAYASHVSECFKLARQVDIALKQIDPRIAFSIDVLHETIAFAEISYQSLGVSLPHSTDLTYVRASQLTRLTANGWCADEARYILTRFRGAAIPFFLSNMRKTHTIQDHSNCTDDKCWALQIDTKAYRARHRLDACSCTLVSVDSHRLEEILKAGQMPLLDIRKNPTTGQLHVQLMASRGDLPYVALSHIWADGLGNPHANALYACQLAQLEDLARGVFKAQAEDDKNDQIHPLIWLDTLCCPAEPGQAKTIAMGMMRKTYREATHVLVLDKTMRNQNYNAISPLQAVIMTFIAPWNRRLWCLQEGALAKNLWFQFQERPVSLNEVLGEIRKAQQTGDPVLVLFALEIGSLYRRLVAFFNPIEKAQDKNFISIVRAVSGRSVSVPSDESLCLAAMFDFDVELLAEENDQQLRMAKWWQMMCIAGLVPSRVAFLPVPKLEVSGYRWAPDSLLNHRLRIHTTTDMAQFNPRGLMLRCAGIKLSIAQDIGHSVRCTYPATDPVLLRNGKTNRWYSCHLTPLPNETDGGYTSIRPPHITSTSLFDFVKNNDTNQPILLVRDTLDPTKPSYQISEALLTSTYTSTSPPSSTCTHPGSPISFVQTYSFVHLVLRSTATTYLLHHAHTIALDLRQHPVSQTTQYQQDPDSATPPADPTIAATLTPPVAELLMARLTKLLAEDDGQLSASLAYEFPGGLEGGLAALVGHIRDLYFGRYFVVDEVFGVDTLWCVD